MVWPDRRDSQQYAIYGTLVKRSGSVVHNAGFAISKAANSQHQPSIAHDGSNFLVVWSDARDTNDTGIFGARVTGAGTALDSPGFQISTSTEFEYLPSVAFDGTNYLVVWEGAPKGSTVKNIAGGRVSTAGKLLGTSDIAIAAGSWDQASPTVAWGKAGYWVVWQDHGSGSRYDIHGAQVSSSGVVQTPLALFATSSHKRYPAVASSGVEILTVWTDYRNTPKALVYGARVGK